MLKLHGCGNPLRPRFSELIVPSYPISTGANDSTSPVCRNAPQNVSRQGRRATTVLGYRCFDYDLLSHAWSYWHFLCQYPGRQINVFEIARRTSSNCTLMNRTPSSTLENDGRSSRPKMRQPEVTKAWLFTGEVGHSAGRITRVSLNRTGQAFSRSNASRRARGAGVAVHRSG